MPTQKPRLSITVEPDTFKLVQRLSDLGGGSVAAIIRELLEASTPVLQHMVDAAEAYATANAEKQAEMRAAVEAAESRVLESAKRAQDEFSGALGQVSGKK